MSERAFIVMGVDDSKHRYPCPDCGRPLKRMDKSRKLHCTNPECPVITVRHSKGRPRNRILRVTRAAMPLPKS